MFTTEKLNITVQINTFLLIHFKYKICIVKFVITLLQQNLTQIVHF